MHLLYSVSPVNNDVLSSAGPSEATTDSPVDIPATDTEFFIRSVFETDPVRGCELLFRLYYRPLCTHAVRSVYVRETAEDLVADVFYTFWNTRAFETINQSYRAYLFRSVRNRALNYLTNELKKTDSLDQAEPAMVSSFQEPEAIMRFDELHHKINELVDSLPPQCRKVFILHRFEGQKAREIAEKLHLSVRTVEVHIAKALSVLREGLRSGWLMWGLLPGAVEFMSILFFR